MFTRIPGFGLIIAAVLILTLIRGASFGHVVTEAVSSGISAPSASST